MKKFISLVLFFSAFLLTSCNGLGNKDTIVARIGNENLYAEDLDFIVLQEQGGLGFQEKYRAALEDYMLSLAMLSDVETESSSYDSAWKEYESVISNRLLTIAYTKYHLMDRLGYSDEELKKYFNEHRSEFGDSVTYLQVRKNVAGRYLILNNQDSLKRFNQEKLLEKNEPEKVELLIFVGDSLAVSDAEKKCNAGVFGDSLTKTRHITVSQGREKGVYQDSSVIRALFLADSMTTGTCRSFAVKEKSSMIYFVAKVLGRIAPVLAREEDYRELFKETFVLLYRESLVEKVQADMENLKTVKIEKLVPADPHKFYEDNRDKFMTAPGYEVYHVAMKDSVVLAKTMANVKDLESFKAVAATISENEETSEKDGLVGRVKKDYALPYGIGMMPALFAELEGKQVGYISSVIRSAADSLYHSFYVSAIVPSELKSFDRVEKRINEMYAGDVQNLDLSTVLVTKDGKPLYIKADLMKVFNAEPGMPYNARSHQGITKMLAQAYEFGEKARQIGVDKSWEYRALKRVARMEFMLNAYERKSSTEQKALQVPENQKKFEYYLNSGRLYKGKTYEEALPQVMAALESKLRTNQKILSRMEAWNKTRVFFYDNSKAALAPVTTAEGFMALGDSAAQRQDFDKAVYAYQKVMDLFASHDTLFRTAAYNLAQVYSDAQRYEEAAGCYNVFLKVWPDAPETEKAMFSLGFILSENLNRNDQALEVLEDFQKRFPKSELKESVDWLVENIKSDGKLAEDLMKKIEAEE